MKRATTLLLLGLCLLGLSAQTEPDVHLQRIRARSPQDSALLEHVLHEELVNPADWRFLTDRDLLRALCVSVCTSDSVVIHDTLADGRRLDLRLYLRPFDSRGHALQYFPGPDSLIEAIDSLPAYGAGETLPTKRLDSLAITLDGQALVVPPEAYRCLYAVNLCDLGYFAQPVAAYPSLDGRYLYLYLYGGEGAGTYFAKLVFDQTHYLTRIVTEYGPLRRFGAIRPDFVGY